ncbi:YkvA family protein [Brachyspira innocens]|uniref:YkvA family protein n=1 Tax=Brachyspira innocens TaxID=13264 RepID=A0ABT8Z0W8_9SPIR|nr:YkvA family protein [Brachyspira innocens]MDO6994299.1 YkvA family protein [Brachyspira innocens]MDO7021252.1 YkvA family protein [Brachyspira innocens]
MKKTDNKNKDYVEIPDEDLEILGKDGIYRKYSTYKKNNRKSRLIHWIPFLLAVIYTISPIDLVPDRIPIGKLDDIILLAITLYYGLKKADFSDNPIINVIIRNIILSTTITVFVMMIIIYCLAVFL